jgi:hypothetical protein
VHFGLKIWRNFESNQAKWKLIRPEREHPCDVAPRRSMSTSPPYTRARTPMPTYDRRTKAACRVYCAPKVGDALPTPAGATRPPLTRPSPHRLPPLAVGSPHVANRLRAMLSLLWTRSSGETTSTRRLAYKPPFFFLMRALLSPCPLPSAIGAASELPSPLARVTHRQLY